MCPFTFEIQKKIHSFPYSLFFHIGKELCGHRRRHRLKAKLFATHSNMAFTQSPPSRARAAINHPCVSWLSMTFVTCLGLEVKMRMRSDALTAGPPGQRSSVTQYQKSSIKLSISTEQTTTQTARAHKSIVADISPFFDSHHTRGRWKLPMSFNLKPLHCAHRRNGSRKVTESPCWSSRCGLTQVLSVVVFSVSFATSQRVALAVSLTSHPDHPKLGLMRPGSFMGVVGFAFEFGGPLARLLQIDTRYFVEAMSMFSRVTSISSYRRICSFRAFVKLLHGLVYHREQHVASSVSCITLFVVSAKISRSSAKKSRTCIIFRGMVFVRGQCPSIVTPRFGRVATVTRVARHQGQLRGVFARQPKWLVRDAIVWQKTPRDTHSTAQLYHQLHNVVFVFVSSVFHYDVIGRGIPTRRGQRKPRR